jgi:phage baseplate assembly protein W
VVAVVTAEPEVVVDPVALTAEIVQAVADMPAPAPESIEEIVQAVADIIATATGVDAVSPEVQQQIADAVAMPADPALDDIEKRLDVAEAKVDSLLGK